MPQLTLQVSRLLHLGVPHSSSTWLWAKHQRVGISPWCRYQESTSLPSLQACLQAEALSSFLAHLAPPRDPVVNAERTLNLQVARNAMQTADQSCSGLLGGI